MSGFEAGLVGLVVLRDVVLVGGAVYKRASDLNWEVILLILESECTFPYLFGLLKMGS